MGRWRQRSAKEINWSITRRLAQDRLAIGWPTVAGLPALGHVRELKTDDSETMTAEVLGERVREVGIHAGSGAVCQDDCYGGSFGAMNDPVMLLRPIRHWAVLSDHVAVIAGRSCGSVRPAVSSSKTRSSSVTAANIKWSSV
jgi:hypothetical protein